jgi:hypothetical protein
VPGDGAAPAQLTLAGAVRWPIDRAAVRLRMSDRVVSHLPGIMQRTWEWVEGERAGSRMRRWLLTRALTAGWGALDRLDFEYLGRYYDPEVTLVYGKGMPMDVAPLVHGWTDVCRELERMYEVWIGDQQPLEVIDVGGAFMAARVELSLTGTASGIEMKRDTVILYEISRGKVLRQWNSTDDAEIEEWLAARLSELAQPSGGGA